MCQSDFSLLKGALCNRCDLTPCPMCSLGHDANEHSSFKNTWEGIEDCRLHYFPFQRLSIIDELLGKLTAAGHKPKKVCHRLMIRNNLKNDFIVDACLEQCDFLRVNAVFFETCKTFF